MLSLPNELLINILKFLSLKDIINLSLVNKFFFELTKENEYWNFNSKINNYSKLLTFINHCKKIKHFEDFSLNFKYYICKYPQLFKNNLQTIHIRVTDKYELSFIKNNRNLKDLKLKCNLNLKEYYILNLFDYLPYLKSISLNNTIISDLVIIKLNNYNLHSLSLEACINIEKISYINQTKLKKLEIISYRSNNVAEIIGLVKKQTCLEELNLSFSDINLFTVSTIIDIGSKLTKLNLSYPQGIINNLSAYMIANNCKKLKELYLNNTTINNYGVFFIVRGCKNIKKLGLAGTLIKDYSLVEIGNFYPDLERLEIEFNDITRIGIYNLLLRCKKIKYLNIMNDNFNIKFLQDVFNTIKYNNLK